MNTYDVIIIGAGPGGIFSAYELAQKSNLSIGVFEAGHQLEKRFCPIDGKKVKTCIGCKPCSIMNGFGGAGAFSDGKYNLTNDFGGTLHEKIGPETAMELMRYVDDINMPHGVVVNENTNGIITVNGHSFEDPEKKTENTNFALLVEKRFSAPFKDSNGYGESIARLSNMLGGGVIVQRFGDLERGRRSTEKRIEEGLVRPTLAATPGDLSLVLPKRILDAIIEMIYALDKIAPGTANDDTLLYGVEVKFYNMEVQVDENLETMYPGLFIIGDGSGVTHSLSHASASGVFAARKILERTGEQS